ncbi:hypothetical protein VTN00DRAFT_4258 [Thermoascus crustaceus]|uniref:uncharacterized protein n=1 Tax=Thermoascus crustaceus TaxID=5088 RepID=UPI003742280F
MMVRRGRLQAGRSAPLKRPGEEGGRRETGYTEHDWRSRGDGDGAGARLNRGRAVSRGCAWWREHNSQHHVCSIPLSSQRRCRRAPEPASTLRKTQQKNVGSAAWPGIAPRLWGSRDPPGPIAGCCCDRRPLQPTSTRENPPAVPHQAETHFVRRRRRCPSSSSTFWRLA